MKSDTIRNDYAAARISAISAIIAAEAIGVTLLLILIQSLLKAVTPLTSESILMLVLGSFVRTGTTAFCIFGVASALAALYVSACATRELACPIFTQKTAPYPIKSGVQHRFFLSYSINSIIMLCAFCACTPIRQALSPAQNRSLPSPQSGQTNRPHKQSAGFSGQAGQCPGALSRSSA